MVPFVGVSNLKYNSNNPSSRAEMTPNQLIFTSVHPFQASFEAEVNSSSPFSVSDHFKAFNLASLPHFVDFYQHPRNSRYRHHFGPSCSRI